MSASAPNVMHEAELALMDFNLSVTWDKLRKARAAVEELVAALDHHYMVTSECCHPEEFREACQRVQAAINAVKGKSA